MIDVGVVYGRFQILHLKHLEYILAAKMRCRKLYVGITFPDGSYIGEDPEMDEEGKKSANPLTYFERFEMIRDCLLDFKVPREAFDIIPFPMEREENLRQYMPNDAVCFLSICDAKTERDEKLLKSMGYAAEVLWRRNESDKGITGTQVRQRILADEKWSDLVPKSVYEYIISNGIDNRIKYTK
ncbi:MAG: nicotinate-nucleotide adenylyltransferase [Bariatricus sp.]